jgi:hypothetical protein
MNKKFLRNILPLWIIHLYRCLSFISLGHFRYAQCQHCKHPIRAYGPARINVTAEVYYTPLCAKCFTELPMPTIELYFLDQVCLIKQTEGPRILGPMNWQEYIWQGRMSIRKQKYRIEHLVK